LIGKGKKWKTRGLLWIMVKKKKKIVGTTSNPGGKEKGLGKHLVVRGKNNIGIKKIVIKDRFITMTT